MSKLFTKSYTQFISGIVGGYAYVPLHQAEYFISASLFFISLIIYMYAEFKKDDL